jgi:hypothetical protein
VDGSCEHGDEPSCSLKCLDVSQSFGPPWPVTGIALPLYVLKLLTYNFRFHFEVWDLLGIELYNRITSMRAVSGSSLQPRQLVGLSNNTELQDVSKPITQLLVSRSRHEI